MIDLFYTNTQFFALQDINWWTRVWITGGLLWCFNLPFEFSFWRHPFTAEDSLARSDARRICDASDVMNFLNMFE